MQDYEITSNRRSTNQIIQLLNHLRTDINQNCVRKEEGLSPCIQVGDLSLCLQKVQEYQPTILARNNATVSELKMSGNNGINTWDSYRSVDSNLDRVTLLHDVLYAVESVISNDYSEGLRYAKRVFRRRIDNSKFSDYEQKVSAIELLDDLTKKREWYLDITIRDFNN
jgi:DNA helicase-2/ATP-dependent DNA helicase PcrA